MKHGDLGVISKPLRHSRLFLSSPLDSPFFRSPSSPLPPVTSASFGLRWLRLKANEATNAWKDRNLLCFKFHVQHNNVAEDVQRSRSVLHAAWLYAPFLTNNPPPSLSIPFPSLSGPWLRDRSTCRGLELKCIDLSLTGNKLIPPPASFFSSLYQKAHPVHTFLSQARMFSGII